MNGTQRITTGNEDEMLERTMTRFVTARFNSFHWFDSCTADARTAAR